jgi:hypothetical protein
VLDLLVRPELSPEQAADLYNGPARHLNGGVRYWVRGEHTPEQITAAIVADGGRSGKGRKVLIADLLGDRWFADRDRRVEQIVRGTDPDLLLGVAGCPRLPGDVRVGALTQLNSLAEDLAAGDLPCEDLAGGSPVASAAAVGLPRHLLSDRLTKYASLILDDVSRSSPTLASRMIFAIPALPEVLILYLHHHRFAVPADQWQAVADALCLLLQRPTASHGEQLLLADLLGAVTGASVNGSEVSVEPGFTGFPGWTPAQRVQLHAAASSPSARSLLAALPDGEPVLAAQLLSALGPPEQAPISGVSALNGVADWLLESFPGPGQNWPVLLQVAEDFTGTAQELLDVVAGLTEHPVRR